MAKCKNYIFILNYFIDHMYNLYDYNPTINKCFKCKNITQYINSNKDKICKLCLKKYNLM